ncbi:dihydroxyacetone kinase subunit DhaL [uncultured Acetobacterium sp.]|jgi:dihydroxyacetone kinase-like protein|uniref:dihydroxyacetone kinase subunit DhaL n=1 Tax=uncultured Acetobacterium sp. TaxID=217139 RepID=UPI0024243BC7|nr:dihydroxyacetone kinase subunit DhaL [uncultured Acetobacterium sp.]MBU4541291.1 dihydroxyacetone kinase subunit L [Bacillota bacterium]MDP2843984.1 dihydroxyacetone kinase subunit DhaL [Acetobacterium sp.]
MSDYILSKDYFLGVIDDLIVLAEEKKVYFSELDSAIGDGDHGMNLSIGFREVNKNLDGWKGEDINSIFKNVGTALLDKVGGASGPLYGGFFSKFGVPAKGKEAVDFDEFIEMMEAGVAIIEKRGKAVVGDKTMVDTLRPAVDALKKAYQEDGLAPKEAMKKALDVGSAGSDSTIPIIARKGRAMRLGERAIGHRDPGSASSAAILEIFYNRMP